VGSKIHARHSVIYAILKEISVGRFILLRHIRARAYIIIMIENTPFQKIEVNDVWGMEPDDDPNCLLGKRFLCRGSGGMIIGPSGAGKSSFILQFACSLAIGKPFFGIGHPKKGQPLRVLLVQAENDALEVAEVIKSIAEAEKWSQATKKLLHENLHIYCIWEEVGEKFAAWLGGRAKDHEIDVAFVDPLMSFCGGNVTNNKDMSAFLRQNINSQLKKQNHKNPDLMNFGMIVAHHTGKTGDEPSEDPTSYDGMGASELTNWSRFVMNITKSKLSTTEQRVFNLSITKRGNRSGMLNSASPGSYKCVIQHSIKQGIKPVTAKNSENGHGTGLNWIYWEKHEPAIKGETPPKSGAKRIRPPNPRTAKARAARAAASSPVVATEKPVKAVAPSAIKA